MATLTSGKAAEPSADEAQSAVRLGGRHHRGRHRLAAGACRRHRPRHGRILFGRQRAPVHAELCRPSAAALLGGGAGDAALPQRGVAGRAPARDPVLRRLDLADVPPDGAPVRRAGRAVGGQRAQYRAGVHAGPCELGAARRAADVLHAGNQPMWWRRSCSRSRGRRPLLWWLAAGPLGGLAMLSKYTGVFVFVGVLAYVLTVPKARRRQLATPGPWLAVALALDRLFAGDRVEPAAQRCRAVVPDAAPAGRQPIHPLWLLEFLGGQALYLFPLLFVPFVMALWRALRAGRREPGAWLIALIAVGPIVLFNVISLLAHSQPHWPMPGWVFTIPLFGRDAAALAAARPRFARRYMAWSAGIVAVILAALTWQTLRGGLIPASWGPRADVTLDLVDWSDLKPALEARGLLGPDAVVASPIWMYCRQGQPCAGAGRSGDLRVRQSAAVPLSRRPEPVERPRHAGDRAGGAGQCAICGRRRRTSSTGSTPAADRNQARRQGGSHPRGENGPQPAHAGGAEGPKKPCRPRRFRPSNDRHKGLYGVPRTTGLAARF